MRKIKKILGAILVVVFIFVIFPGCEKSSGKRSVPAMEKTRSGDLAGDETGYRSSQMRVRLPWLIGAASFLLILVVVLFARNRVTANRLESLVRQRTGDLELEISRLNAIFDASPDLIYCKDLNLRYTLCNKFMADYFGFDKNKIIGRVNAEVPELPAEFLEMDDDADREIINKGRMVVYEESIPSGKGEQRLFETMKFPLMKDGAVAGMAGIAHDITQRKMMEEEAHEASRSKSAFLANMSHELRTPLNVVIGLTDLILEENNLAADVLENLLKISNAGNTLLGIVNDILDFSKIETGKLSLAPSEYHMSSLLNDVITLMITRLGEKPVSFRLNIGDDLPARLYGDDLRVKQIFNNLLSNAVKYTDTGRIELSVNCVGDGNNNIRDNIRNNVRDNVRDNVWMEITVSDTGIGIHKEDLEKLFTDYYQVESQASRRIEGTGLGLSITKKLAEMMNGEISAESEYGQGTVFRVRIRQGFAGNEVIGQGAADNLRKFRYAEDMRSIAKKLERPDLSFARVLLVDDMQTNLDVAAGLLRKYKMQVDCVLSGQEAIERLRRGRPVYNAIFMDHMMPGMDGLETADTIRGLDTEYARAVPIIALTANAIQGTENIFFAHDFQDFLSKPIDIIQLDYLTRKWVKPYGSYIGKKDLKAAGKVRGESQDENSAYPEDDYAVFNIPGLDTDKGLSLYGNEMDIYLEVLRSYVSNMPVVLNKLGSVSRETLKDYAIGIHGLKGTSDNIGAEKIREAALNLEAMAKAGDLDGVLSKNESFISDTADMAKEIKKWLEQYDAVTSRQPAGVKTSPA